MADFHVTKACELFGVLPHEVTPEMRRIAKTWNFADQYGSKPKTLKSLALQIEAIKAKS